MRNKTVLLVVDPQNDFCDIPERELPIDPDTTAGDKPQPLVRPALPVPGGDADMRRLAAFVDRAGARLDEIHVTLDSHHPVDIAHPAWWCDSEGKPPPPFTLITVDDLQKGIWRARDPALQEHALRYVRALEAAKRYQLVVWPEHCLIGSWGHNVHRAVKQAIDRWAREHQTQIHYAFKGMNPKTEHYSAIQAEVPDPGDASTMPNAVLLKLIAEADTVVVAGEALSHCVANTVRDLAGDTREKNIGKLVLLTDCSSPVGGFEKFGSDFLEEFRSRGMRTALSTGFLA